MYINTIAKCYARTNVDSMILAYILVKCVPLQIIYLSNTVDVMENFRICSHNVLIYECTKFVENKLSNSLNTIKERGRKKDIECV